MSIPPTAINLPFWNLLEGIWTVENYVHTEKPYIVFDTFTIWFDGVYTVTITWNVRLAFGSITLDRQDRGSWDPKTKMMLGHVKVKPGPIDGQVRYIILLTNQSYELPGHQIEFVVNETTFLQPTRVLHAVFKYDDLTPDRYYFHFKKHQAPGLYTNLFTSLRACTLTRTSIPQSRHLNGTRIRTMYDRQCWYR